jgi:hypothetical protein
MFRKGLWIVRLAAIVLALVALVVGGVWLFQAGQAQGYALGIAAAAGSVEAPSVPQAMAPLYPAYGWMWPYAYGPHGLIGLLCLGGVGLIFLVLLGSLFRFPGKHHHARWGEGGWEGRHGSFGPRSVEEKPAAESPKPTA